jgi:pimeloyl-ACP methyl ester carboxylesterase
MISSLARRLLRGAAVLVLILLLGGYIYGRIKDPEHLVLDAAARAKAPGKFVGSSVGTTHYQVTGPDSGEVVVLVHGFSVPFYIWDSTFAALGQAGFRTIRYDLLGRGWSDRPDAAYDGAMYDAQLDELLDSLHVTAPIHLMGLSFGGFVTGHYAATHPARLRTLTMLDPVSSTGHLPRILSWPIAGSWYWQSTIVPTMAEGQPGDFLHPDRFPGWADRYRPQMAYRGFGRALLRSRLMLTHTNFDSLFAAAGRSRVPMLLVWGRQDPTVPFANSAVVLRNIPWAQFFPVDSSGHLPGMEQTALVNARLINFLRERR